VSKKEKNFFLLSEPHPELDSKFEKFDEKGTVRPVIINVSNEWTKRAQRALLANPVQLTLDVDAQVRKSKDTCCWSK
jgi:hypothetical protein